MASSLLKKQTFNFTFYKLQFSGQLYLYIMRMCSIDNFLLPNFLPLSLKLGACHVTGQWDKFKVKKATLCEPVFFVFFSSKNYVFIIFIYFLDEVSNFRKRTLTNQKPELVIRNCSWNCIYLISMDISVTKKP